MSTGKCNDCGKPRMNGSVRCARCHNAWVLMHQMMTNYYKEQKQDHYTFPDDPETEPRPGWGPFKFDWLMKPYREAVEWHDRVTTRGSTAQQAGITNERINVAWKDMLKEMYRTTPRAGFVKRLGWFAGFFVSKINRFFYEGPLR